MAADTKPQGSTDPNLPDHARSYAGFITAVKWSTLIVAIISAIVIYLIAN